MLNDLLYQIGGAIDKVREIHEEWKDDPEYYPQDLRREISELLQTLEEKYKALENIREKVVLGRPFEDDDPGRAV